MPGSSWCGNAGTCACGVVSSVGGFREPAGAWQGFRFGRESGFEFGMNSGFEFGMDSGAHRWLSRAQLVGVDL